MNDGVIAVKSMGIVRRGDSVLASKERDPVTGQAFFRLVGGSVEYGETALDALHREFHEELDSDVVDVRLIAVAENIFDYDGAPGHEVVFVYDCRLVDVAIYERNAPGTILDVPGSELAWVELADLRSGDAVLYPRAAAELLL